MYDRSKIFTEAWERVRKTGETINDALKAVWDFYRKKNFADKFSTKTISIWEKLNSAKEISDYISAKNGVDKIVTVLKATYQSLVAINTEAAIITANIIASVVNKRNTTPSNRQMWAIFCGAWENEIILNF